MVSILEYLDVVDRAMNGERISENEYEMRLFKAVQELVKEYHLKPDPENPVPSDDAIADEMFEAGLDLSLKIGAYCVDTKRVIKVTEEEIREAIKENPKKIMLGAGKDARELS